MMKFINFFIGAFILLWLFMFVFVLVLKLLIIAVFFTFHNSWLWNLIAITIVSCWLATEKIIKDNKQKPKNITVSSLTKAKV